MASITRRSNGWRAQVKVQGKRKTKTFETKAAAREWAADMEAELRRPKGQAANKTFGQLLGRYATEVSPQKKGFRWEAVRIARIQEHDDLAKVNLRDIKQSDIAAWRDRRLKAVQPASVLREWNLIRSAITIACKEWGWLVDNPMDGVQRPQDGKPRTRRPTEEELARLSLVFGYDPRLPPKRLSQRVGAAMWFAIETAMRAGEIASLTRSDIVGRVAKLRNTKNGSDRDVPLSKRARDILKPLGDNLFDVTSMQITSSFRSAKQRAGVEGLTFHDMRREGTTRLSKKLDLLTLAKVTGHRDLTLLKEVYYAPDMDAIADTLD